MWFQTLKVPTISQGQGCWRSNSHTRCLLPMAMSLPCFVGITIKHLDKSEKMWFQTLKTATISQGHGRWRSNSRTRCPLPIRMSLPSFARITKIDLEKSAKSWFQTLKMAAIFPRSKSFEGKFTDKVPLTPNNAPAKFCSNNQNSFAVKCKNVISDP